MISAIVAVDKDWGIGFEGQLLEHLPPDMEYFKETTKGHIVVMGRKTWDSLPKKPLKDRINIVISNSMFPFEGLYEWDIIKHLSICMTMNYAISYIHSINTDNDVFIIGGGEIYKQLLPYCDRVYVTLIEKSHDNVDTYFPNLDKDPNWEVSTCTELRDYKDIPYAFLTYDRIS